MVESKLISTNLILWQCILLFNIEIVIATILLRIYCVWRPLTVNITYSSTYYIVTLTVKANYDKQSSAGLDYL